MNPLVCDIIGYTKKELIGQCARMLYPTQEDFEFVGKEKYRQIAEHGTGVVETRWQKKDGSIIDVLLASTPVDSKDLAKGVIFTTMDITERKQAEEELKQHREHLEELVKARTLELEDKNAELKRFNKLFIGREFRIKELRDKIKSL